MVRRKMRVPLLTGTLCSHKFEGWRREIPCAAREVGEQRPFLGIRPEGTQFTQGKATDLMGRG